VDILSCSAEGLRTFYGIQSSGTASDRAREAIQRFDLQAVIMTTREEQGMWRNRVGATAVVRDAGGSLTTFEDRERDVEIVDRLGAGDAFLAGFLANLLLSQVQVPHLNQGDHNRIDQLNHISWERATAWGGAAAALKHSIRGDFPILTAAEIIQEIEAPALRVQR
jgi:sugar/nucleoside kinase (ribokinase family)